MRRVSARALTTLLVLMAALLVLVACGVQPTGQPLSAIHAEVDSWSESAATDGACLECHDPSSIIRATQNYDGSDDVTVHEPPVADHTSASCISCHRTDGAPILTCNNQTGCHAYTLPEGWTILVG
jgi:hypothetical protein